MSKKLPRRSVPYKPYWLFSLLAIPLVLGSGWWLETRYLETRTYTTSEYTDNLPEPFPVGVNPHTKEITESTALDPYLTQHFSELRKTPSRLSVLTNQLTTTFQKTTIYQFLASPTARQLVVLAGDRPEEVFARAASVFGWDAEEQAAFTNIIDAGYHTHQVLPIIPGRHTLPRNSSPLAVYDVLETDFLATLKSRYPDDTDAVLPLREAMTIASLLEREAADFYDMRYISGIIWNRLFIDMHLQIDATLQYAKASTIDSGWWPPVVPDDKYIESPYNTYQNKDLPPAPIAIPSIGAVIATLNPRQTDCLFYFHSRSRSFFCSPTYEEHVEKLIEQYGQGR